MIHKIKVHFGGEEYTYQANDSVSVSTVLEDAHMRDVLGLPNNIVAKTVGQDVLDGNDLLEDGDEIIVAQPAEKKNG